MSKGSARLFSWLLSAPLYERMFTETIAQIKRGNGEIWLDFGCGPGFLARQASGHGYRSFGLDKDADMIEAARKLDLHDSVDFRQGQLTEVEDLRGRVRVFSLASVLLLIPNPLEFLLTVKQILGENGEILVIENSECLTPLRALREILKSKRSLKNLPFILWAIVRNGSCFELPAGTSKHFEVVKVPLIEGMARLAILRPLNCR